MTTSTKLSGGSLSPRAPSKGSFPLDHLSECRQFAIAYERCLKGNDKQTNKCRKEARDYLECRMERGLMAKEEWRKLGLGKLDEDAPEELGAGSANEADGYGVGKEIGTEKDRRKGRASMLDQGD